VTLDEQENVMPIAIDHDLRQDMCRTRAGSHSPRRGHDAVTAEPAPPTLGDGGEPGAEDPFEVIYRLHGWPVYRFLLRLTLGDRRDAEDLLQETFFRAWRYLQDHTADVTHLRPWLYTVARRAAIDAGRARQARPAEVAITERNLRAACDDIERMLVMMTMRRGLRALTLDHRRVLVEVFYNGRTAREAAAALGIPEGTVKSRTHYALRALALATGTGAER
jgi:RNA polymerase sigma-70 factor (ECF subfamily)